MRARTDKVHRKWAGLLGLFVWLAVAGFPVGPSPALAEPSLLDQLKKGYPSSTPERKSLMPPLRLRVEKAEPAFDARTQEPIVVITMAQQSGRMFYELTLKNIGRRLVLRIDGQVAAEPIIREPIKDGRVQISGSFTVQSATELAERLSKGEAKVEVELVSD